MHGHVKTGSHEPVLVVTCIHLLGIYKVLCQVGIIKERVLLLLWALLGGSDFQLLQR